MSQPFVYIGTFRLKQGKFEAFKASCSELVEFVESNEPRLIAFNIYANEAGTEASVVQVHPDADSMLLHMKLLHDHIAGATDGNGPLEVTTSTQVYGTPTDEVLEMIKQFDPGVPLMGQAASAGRFTRSAAEQAVGA